MKLGLLEVGRCNPRMTPKYGAYPPLFHTLIGRADPSIAFERVRILEGAPPPDPGACDGWLITGSKHGVYDDLPWLPGLTELILEAYARRIPVIGVCFGHQLLAQALGGRVEKAAQGWGTGRHIYDTTPDPAWFGAPPRALALHAFHQDQVVAPPEDARTLARSAFCPYAALAFGPSGETRAISIQTHPEFDAEFERDLILSRRGEGLPETAADAALETLGLPVDDAWVAQWFVRFLRAAAGETPARG